MSITNIEGERAWRHSDGRAFHLSAARKETECKPYREKVCGRTKAAVLCSVSRDRVQLRIR